MPTLTGEAFLDVVLSDGDLLRQEFDAIVAASWAEPPEPPPPAAPPAPGDRPAPWPTSPGWAVPDGRHPRLPDAEHPWRGRQRAPPTWK